MMGILDGKTIVITGAGRGLGEAYAIHAAQAGANVVVNDIDAELAERTAENIRHYGGKAVANGSDVGNPDEAEAIVRTCLEEFGRIDGLVNNAALNYDAPPWEDDIERIRELFQVNVFGVINCGLAAIRAMRDNGTAGSIVNITSGAMMGQRKLATYAASKGAVASLTYSWALDLDDLGIRVNAVCPVAHTRMVWNSERSLRATPPERTPSKVAPVVLYLLSDRSHGITGQVIRCNGRQLHVVGQPYLKEPILERDSWDTASVERAFTEVFQTHLEPFGLEKRLPERLHGLLNPCRGE